MQSFDAFPSALDLVDFVSVQWQSEGCFFVDCLLVEFVFAILFLLFRLPPSECSMTQRSALYTLRKKIYVI